MKLIRDLLMKRSATHFFFLACPPEPPKRKGSCCKGNETNINWWLFEEIFRFMILQTYLNKVPPFSENIGFLIIGGGVPFLTRLGAEADAL